MSEREREKGTEGSKGLLAINWVRQCVSLRVCVSRGAEAKDRVKRTEVRYLQSFRDGSLHRQRGINGRREGQTLKYVTAFQSVSPSASLLLRPNISESKLSLVCHRNTLLPVVVMVVVTRAK